MSAILGIPFGILLLIGGGTALVAGASQVAERLGVSPLIIGLTIVGFGTSAPELIMVMALDGMLEGRPSRIGRSDSVVLLLLFGIFLYISVRDVLRARKKDRIFTEIEEHPSIAGARASGLWTFVLLVLGFFALFVGGEVTVRSAAAVSESMGISAAIIGLFVVAVGTSMPELVTSVIAAWRKESDLAMGNIVGSNLFNSLIVLPAGGLAATMAVPDGGLLDLVLCLLLTAVLIPVFFLGKARLGRASGLALLFVYFAYAFYRVSLA